VSFAEFESSVAHLAFYVSSDQANGIKSPKAWILSKLRLGYYPKPPGYISWEEKIAEARLSDAQDKLRHIRELEKKQLDVDYEIWLAQKSDKERQALLTGSYCQDPYSQAAKAILRNKFYSETNRRDPCANTDDPQEHS
jgi:hypothetical protein